MKSLFWFVGTLILLVCLAGAAIDWLAQPPAVQAAQPDAGEVGPAALVTEGGTAQPVTGASPAVQVVIALSLGLFIVLSLVPVIADTGHRVI